LKRVLETSDQVLKVLSGNAKSR